jgi:hypothetical protein
MGVVNHTGPVEVAQPGAHQAQVALARLVQAIEAMPGQPLHCGEGLAYTRIPKP